MKTELYTCDMCSSCTSASDPRLPDHWLIVQGMPSFDGVRPLLHFCSTKCLLTFFSLVQRGAESVFRTELK